MKITKKTQIIYTIIAVTLSSVYGAENVNLIYILELDAHPGVVQL